jgi:hypothetical protein
MKKTILTFGLIAGALSAVMMLATIPFADKIGFNKSLILGYTTIVLSSLLVFFGVRSYRENVSGGRLTFGRAFAVGILITLVANFCYVATWEIVYSNFMPDFTNKYAAQIVNSARNSGASQEAAEEKAREFKKMYQNPAIRAAYTFAEPFPVGLAMTLLSAAILRRKAATQAA